MHTSPTVQCKLRQSFAIFALALLAPNAHADSVDLYKIPEASREQLSAIPKNLARWYLGANLLLEKHDQLIRIEAADVDNFAESILLSDDSALTVPVLRGEQNFIVDFSRYCTLTRFLLNNRNASGTLQLFTSNTLQPSKDDKWLPVTPQPVSFGRGEIPSLSFAEIETRYLLVRLNVQQPGEIGSIGATGPANITEVAFDSGKEKEEHTVDKAKSPIVDYDYGSAFAGARVRYVSGGAVDNIFALIDDDPTTAYSFPRGQEAIIVLDMANPTEFRSVNASIRAAEPGILHIYLTSQLADAFETSEPIGVATLTNPDGHTERIEFADGADAPSLLAGNIPREFVRVPIDYFRSIVHTHSVHITPDSDPCVKIFDQIKHRYVIFRFIPDNANALPEMQTANYDPSGAPFEIVRAAAPAPSGFSGVSVIGQVQVDDVIFTMEQEPVGPPPPPPPPPPPLSR